MTETQTTAHNTALSRQHAALIAVAGVASALALAFIVTRLPEQRAILLLAVLTGVFSGIYFGVALSPTGAQNTLMNTAMALIFMALALLGAWASPLFFALACFLHAAWDYIIGHPRALNEPIAPWYVPICVGADIVLGIFIIIWFFPGHT